MGLSAEADSLASPASNPMTAGPGSQQMTALSVAIVIVFTFSSVRADTGMNIKCKNYKILLRIDQDQVQTDSLR
jgi:hypothetical protein